MSNKRIIIVGSVAGEARAAVRARRLCEDCEIIMFERGPLEKPPIPNFEKD